MLVSFMPQASSSIVVQTQRRGPSAHCLRRGMRAVGHRRTRDPIRPNTNKGENSFELWLDIRPHEIFKTDHHNTLRWVQLAPHAHRLSRGGEGAEGRGVGLQVVVATARQSETRRNGSLQLL